MDVFNKLVGRSLATDIRLVLLRWILLSWLNRRVVRKVSRWVSSSASVSSIGTESVSLGLVSIGHDRGVGSTVSLTFDWVSKPSSSVSESDNRNGIVGKIRFSSLEISAGKDELDDCWLSSSTGFGNDGNWNQSIFKKYLRQTKVSLFRNSSYKEPESSFISPFC